MNLVKGSLAAALALSASLAAVAVATPYVALRGSLAFADDVRTNISGTPLRMSMDTGWGASAALGNQVGPVHLELEAVYRNLTPNKIVSGATTNVRGNVEVIAPMANVILDFPLDNYVPESFITPFIGAGIGGMYAQIDPQGTGIPIGESDSWGFAYQLMGGLSVPVMNNVTMRIAYRYLSSPNLRFHANSGAGFKTGMDIHSVDIGLDFRF